MKILFVAVFSPNSTNVAQSRGFKSLGHDVYEYDYRSRAQILKSSNKRDAELIQTIRHYEPDITIISKGNGIGLEPIREANEYGKTVLWYMDAGNNFNTELIEKIKLCTCVICGLNGMVECCEPYNTNSHFVDQCPDELMNFKIDNCQKINDTIFIGNVSSSVHTERMMYITQCAIPHFNNVYGLRHNELVNQTKINVGFAPTDRRGTSVRVYKILAAGGFLMTTPWPGIDKSFTVDKHLVTFESVEEFNTKCKYYLENEKEREQIAQLGMKHVRNNYMPIHWAQKVLYLAYEYSNVPSK